MPTLWWGGGYRKAVRRCSRPFKWSHSRGGYRFEPGHTGNCKPKGR